MRAALVGSGGPVLGREYLLDQPVVTIGRRDENTIVIKDPTVSRKHAEVRRDGDDFVLVDKQSTSGVLVNGQPIQGEQVLQDGDRIAIGTSATFLLQLQPTEAKTISFSHTDLAEQNRTQFITRTDLEDPRAKPAPPLAPLPPATPADSVPSFGTPATPQRPASAVERQEGAPASTAAGEQVAPPVFTPPPSFTPPAAEATPTNLSPLSPGGPAGTAPPAFTPSASFTPPPHSATPDVPRFGEAPSAAPNFGPPPATNTPAGGFSSPPSNFAPSAAPSVAPPPGPGNFSPPPQGGAPGPVGGPMMAAPAKRSSPIGLIIGIVVVVLLLIIAAIVGYLVISGRMSGS